MNRSILKRLQISHFGQKNYKEEIQKFIQMYNATPHGTTGKSPAELLYGRNIRDKLPSVNDIEDVPIDNEARDRDVINKEKGKKREDTARGARDADINLGDKVLVKNAVFPHKLTTNWGNASYEVIKKNGNELLLEGDGRFIRRHVTHVKKVPESTSENMQNTTLPLGAVPNSQQQKQNLHQPLPNLWKSRKTTRRLMDRKKSWNPFD